jgi:serine protease Do
MKHFVQIRRSTAVLAVLAAGLIGGVVASMSVSHNVPVFMTNAHAASYEQAALTTFAPVVKHVMPAVVNISSSKVVKNQQMGNGMLEDPFFRRFFGGHMPQNEPRERRAESLGSGVIISPDGYILTNNHVVEGATQVKVSFADQREFPAKVIGTDKPTDVALLKIDQHNLPVLPLSDSSRAQVGDVVLAVGNPFGLGQTVTMGIVSATGRSLHGAIEQYEDFIQTDAAINPGNSGGALINTRGELVGINTAILAGDGGGNQGIGFAIPINLAHNVMDQLLKNGKVTRGYMGIIPQEVTPDLASGFGNPNLKGVAVAQVEPGSPAQQAGLKVGDVISGINGTPVSDVNQFRLQIAGMSPGAKADLKVVRDGREQNVDVALAEMPKKNLRGTGDGDDDDDNGQGAMQGKGEKGALPGVSVQAMSPELRQQLQLPESAHGLVITDVDQSSRAADAGLQQGDVVTQVNHKPVNTVAEFNAAVKAGGANGSTLLLVQRGGGAVFLAVNK